MNALLKSIVLGVCLVAFTFLPQGVSAQEEVAVKEANAVEIASEWLKLVDNKSYAESWKQAAQFFQKGISEEDWNVIIDGARKPMGALKNRELLGKKYMTSLPNAPDGEYVVIQYKVMFAYTEKAFIETVTPMLDLDGQWRVSGYYIYEMPEDAPVEE